MPADRKQRALVTFLLEQVVLTASASSLASQRPGDVLMARCDYVPRLHAVKDISFSCGSPPQLLGGRGVTGRSGELGALWPAGGRMARAFSPVCSRSKEGWQGPRTCGHDPLLRKVRLYLGLCFCYPLEPTMDGLEGSQGLEMM